MGKDTTTKKNPATGTAWAAMLFTGLLTAGAAAEDDRSRMVDGDLIRIPVGQQAGAETLTSLPRTGETRNAVLRRLGEPQERRSPVGDPPISAWEYPDLVVYFEYDHVIHAVRKHRPRIDPQRQEP